jgi:hypothetical protein
VDEQTMRESLSLSNVIVRQFIIDAIEGLCATPPIRARVDDPIPGA